MAKKKLFKSDLSTTDPKQLTEADIFEIAVKAVGIKDLHRNEDRLKTEIKLAYELLKEVAEEL